MECSYSHTPFLKDIVFKQFHNGLYVILRPWVRNIIKNEFSEHSNLKHVKFNTSTRSIRYISGVKHPTLGLQGI